MANTPVKKRRHARGISRLQVVTAALAIVDAEGVEALTMRRLADFLGVYPTTIYWHAGNRSQLLAHVSHEVLSSIEVPHPGDLTVQAISVRCGFGTVETLRQAFVAAYGVSPSHYRGTQRRLAAT